MESFRERAFRRKSLEVVRRQTQLFETSPRSIRISLVSKPRSSTSEACAGTNHAANQSTHESTTTQDATQVAPLRHMTLFDLTAFGITATIGSGIYVLAGAVSHSYAGPSASISYMLAAVVASFSALPYAEMSSTFPMGGSAYSYTYIALGEVFAVMSSLCQCLLYGGSAAAINRSWGDKVVEWYIVGLEDTAMSSTMPKWLMTFLSPGYQINPMAAVITLMCTLLLSSGVRESKFATNMISILNVTLITIMIAGGFILASGVIPQNGGDPRPASFSNLTPFVPPEFGFSGILYSTSIVFFAFLGFDDTCTLAGEAKNPAQNIPRAIIFTLIISSFMYVLGTLALTAMMPYSEIDEKNGFAKAFAANGWMWAAYATAIGELIVLPFEALASMISQTRLLFALSVDLLVPEIFRKLSYADSSLHCGTLLPCIEVKEDKVGNLTANIWICGMVISLLAAFTPFEYIEGLISMGALFLFCLTNSSLLTLKYEKKHDLCRDPSQLAAKKMSMGLLLIFLNTFSIISGLCFAHIPKKVLSYTLASFFLLLALGVTIYIHIHFKKGNPIQCALGEDNDDFMKKRFNTPFMPYLPVLGIVINWLLIVNMGWKAEALLAGYLLMGVVAYGTFCPGKSLMSILSKEVINIENGDMHEE